MRLFNFSFIFGQFEGPSPQSRNLNGVWFHVFLLLTKFTDHKIAVEQVNIYKFGSFHNASLI
jgi:hypothetical protein